MAERGRWICMSCFREWRERSSFLVHGRQKNHPICWAVADSNFFCAPCTAFIREDALNANGKKVIEACTAAVRTLLGKVSLVQSVATRATSRGQSQSQDQDQDQDRGNGNDQGQDKYRGNGKDSLHPNCSEESSISPPGLNNLGNTCFMNSALQSLASLESFCVALSQFVEGVSTTTCPLTCALSDLLATLLQACRGGEMGETKASEPGRRRTKAKARARASSDRNSVDPLHFFDRLADRYDFFERNEQQDSHDFLRLLFNALDDEWDKSARSPGNSKQPAIAPHQRAFGGTMSIRVDCKKCGQRTTKEEPLLDISLSMMVERGAAGLSEVEGLVASLETLAMDDEERTVHRRSTRHDSTMDILDLIAHWMSAQELKGEDAFACENCYKRFGATDESCDAKAGVVYSAAVCRHFLSQLPRCLLIHLQRFSLSSLKARSGGRRRRGGAFVYGKDHSSVRLRERLSLGERVYRLRAMVVHEGATAESGHYVAIVARADRWFRISDSSVSPIAAETALACPHAYLVFYESSDSDQ